MKKFLNYLSVSLTFFCITSCNTTDEPQQKSDIIISDFEVITLNEPTATRSVNNRPNQILKFKDQSALDRTLANVQEMNDSSKRAFFNEIGFEGAYTLLGKAEEELDNAFDIAESLDSVAGIKVIQDCVAKYKGVLQFSDIDLTDVTPSLPFADENAELLGNKEGKIMIGNQLISPKEAPRKSNNAGFITYDARVKVKNGHYSSYFRLGRIGEYLAFQLETYRMIFGIRKHDKKCCYDGEFEIYSNGNRGKVIIHHGRGYWKMHSIARAYSPNVNLIMTNFCSTRNPNNKVSKTIKNILVK